MATVKKTDAEKMVEDMKKKVSAKVDKTRAMAEGEIAKLKKTFDASVKKAEDFVKKNPEKAAAVVAGVGVALGAALTLLLSGGSPKRKGKK